MNTALRGRGAAWKAGAVGLAALTLASVVAVGTMGAGAAKVTLKGTVTVMALGVYSSPEFTVPQADDAVLLAASQINASGGINGKKLVVITCNEDNSPAVAAQCAQKAVSDHVAALVGRTTLNGSAVVPILQKAQIPDIGPLPFSPADINGSNNVSFVFATTGTPGAVSATVALAKEGCKSIAAVYLSPGADAELPAFQATTTALGVTDAGTFPVSELSPQWAPAFQDAISAGGANVCSLVIGAAAFDAGEYQGLSQTTDPNMRVASYANAVPLDVLKTLNGTAAGTTITSGFQFPNSKAAAKYASAFTKAYPSATLDEQSENAYIATEIFAQVADKLKTVNAKTVLAALRADKDVTNPLLLGPLNFTKPNPIAAYKRQFNTDMLAVKYTSSNTTSSLFGGKAINIEQYLG